MLEWKTSQSERVEMQNNLETAVRKIRQTSENINGGNGCRGREGNEGEKQPRRVKREENRAGPRAQ